MLLSTAPSHEAGPDLLVLEVIGQTKCAIGDKGREKSNLITVATMTGEHVSMYEKYLLYSRDLLLYTSSTVQKGCMVWDVQAERAFGRK